MLEKYSFIKCLFYLIPVSFFLISCSSEDIDVTKLQPTELEVTVLNANGQPVPNAEVRLYRSQRAFELLAQDVARGKTNGSGKILFSDLQPVNYYFYAFYKDQGAGLVRSNYGNFNATYFDDKSNISLYDYLTENGLTKVSVSTLFTKPINPTVISFDELRIIYSGEEMDFPSDANDTLDIAFGFFEGGVNNIYAISTSNPTNALVSFTDNSYFFYQESSENILGELYNYSFANPVFYDLNALAPPNNNGGLSTTLDLIPISYNEFTGEFDFNDQLWGLYVNLNFYLSEVIINARATGDYPNRIVIDPNSYLGKNNYALDIILSWN